MEQLTEALHSSIAESTYDEIKKRIISGMYPPGMKLVTQRIAREMGISRTPVVLAVNRLAAEGYAIATPQQGVFVRKYTTKTFRDILEMRLMIEWYSVDVIINNLMYDKKTLKKLRTIAEQYKTLDKHDYDKAKEVECQFHQTFISMMENEEILRVYKQSQCVEAVYLMYRMANMGLDYVTDAFQEHEMLVDLLETGDVEKVKALIEKHIRIPMDRLDWLVKTGRLRD